MKWLETHKLVVIVILCIAGGLFAQNRWQVHQERMADKQQTANDAFQQQAQADIAKRDADFAAFKNTISQQISQLTPQKAVTVLQPIVQGQQPQTITKADLPSNIQQQLPGDPNTHYTLLSDDQITNLGKRELACQITENGLSTCAADKLTMQGRIDNLTKTNQSWQSLGTVPRWSFTALISKAQNSGYKPGALLGYRFTKNFGVAAGAVNNSLVGGVTFNFGGEPKPKGEQ